ncbi:5761_t:CDS:2 [Entrophospora sp. SA101]|nr:10912_t:CDS:2 [Entrophospora sp. SA101]CAJ0838207.1 5761_t:CDS:2 [Entrophospora sp. SA101]
MSIGEYTCSLLLYSGEVCGRTCRRPDRCCLHKNAIDRVHCTDCVKPTKSDSNRCPDHIRGYYVSKYFQKHLKKKNYDANLKSSLSKCNLNQM